MSVWMLIVLLGLLKLPVAALMLWLPFRSDEALGAPEAPDDASEDDGGSRALPAGPLDPHPRRVPRGPFSPRRGPHGTPSPAAPDRVRSGGVRVRAVQRSR